MHLIMIKVSSLYCCTTFLGVWGTPTWLHLGNTHLASLTPWGHNIQSVYASRTAKGPSPQQTITQPTPSTAFAISTIHLLGPVDIPTITYIYTTYRGRLEFSQHQRPFRPTLPSSPHPVPVPSSPRRRSHLLSFTSSITDPLAQRKAAVFYSPLYIPKGFLRTPIPLGKERNFAIFASATPFQTHS